MHYPSILVLVFHKLLSILSAKLCPTDGDLMFDSENVSNEDHFYSAGVQHQ